MLVVRSQDKCKLVKVTGVFVKKLVDGCHVEANSYSDESWDLGIYDTKQRAIEVVDEIQRVLEEYYTKTETSDNNGTVYTALLVYQMPAE